MSRSLWVFCEVHKMGLSKLERTKQRCHYEGSKSYKRKKVVQVTELSQAANTIQGVKVVDVTQEPFEESEGPNLEVRMKGRRDSYLHSLPSIGEGPSRGM
ncbi:hypothetical protein PVK06_042747 [Gossypium arboreum]|uniref:Uncharacterized protein n=1 Tax=Gossypium arboreum TaxID=29729 RepID=A0ABR0MM21_GOSAR|nr:hypothetical protein PVK06_042747 [Gossypium arboreum]